MHRVRPYAGPLGKQVSGSFENYCNCSVGLRVTVKVLNSYELLSIRKWNKETQEESAVFGWFFLRFCSHVTGKNGQRQENSGSMKKDEHRWIHFDKFVYTPVRTWEWQSVYEMSKI